MPSRRESILVAANTVIQNVLDGWAHEISDGEQAVIVYVAGSAAGLEASLSFGAETIGEDQVVPVEGAVGQGPLINQHLMFEDTSVDRDRRILTARNPTGGALTFIYLIVSKPI